MRFVVSFSANGYRMHAVHMSVPDSVVSTEEGMAYVYRLLRDNGATNITISILD